MMNSSTTLCTSFSMTLFVAILLLLLLLLLSTSTTVAFSNNSKYEKNQAFITVGNLSPRTRIRQRSTRSSSSSSASLSSSLSVSPTDIITNGAAVAVLPPIQYELIIRNAVTTTTASNNAQAEFLSDVSSVVMNIPTFFPHIKTSKLRLHYAQVLGRILILGISFLPHHHQQQVVHYEEIAVQLFLLSTSMKPILRSIQLFQCIKSNSTNSSY